MMSSPDVGNDIVRRGLVIKLSDFDGINASLPLLTDTNRVMPKTAELSKSSKSASKRVCFNSSALDLAVDFSMALTNLKPASSNELVSNTFRELVSFFTGEASNEKFCGLSVEYDRRISELSFRRALASSFRASNVVPSVSKSYTLGEFRRSGDEDSKRMIFSVLVPE